MDYIQAFCMHVAASFNVSLASAIKIAPTLAYQSKFRNLQLGRFNKGLELRHLLEEI